MNKFGYSRDTQKLIYAIFGEISNFFTGQEAGSIPYKLDLEKTKRQIKERFLEEYDLKPLKSPLTDFSKFLKDNKYKTIKEAETELKDIFVKSLQSSLIENKTFSLALPCLSQHQANDFVSWLIEICIHYGVPLKTDIRDTMADNYEKAFNYVCLKNKVCAICGKPGELEHYDNVARIGGYKFDNGRELRYMCLCRDHHTESHTIGKIEFSKKYHIAGIFLSDRQIKELKKVYTNHFQAFKEEK